MDRTHEASSVEILIEVLEDVIDPRDLLVKAVEDIKRLKYEMQEQGYAHTQTAVRLSVAIQEVKELAQFKKNVLDLHPDIELDMLRKKLMG